MAINADTGVPQMTGHWIPTNTVDYWDIPMFALDILFSQVTDAISLTSFRRHGLWYPPTQVQRETQLSGENLVGSNLAKVNNLIRPISISDVRNEWGQEVTWGFTWQIFGNEENNSSFNEFSGAIPGHYYGPTYYERDFSGFDGRAGTKWRGITTSAGRASAYGLYNNAVVATKSQVKGFIGPYVIASGYTDQNDNTVQTGIVDEGVLTSPIEVLDIPFPDGNDLPPDPADPTRPLYKEVFNELLLY